MSKITTKRYDADDHAVFRDHNQIGRLLRCTDGRWRVYNDEMQEMPTYGSHVSPALFVKHMNTVSQAA